MSIANDTSGFIEGEPRIDDAQFTHIEELYASPNGYTRLFRCERLGKLHILKALQTNYIGQDFYEQALKKEFNMGFQLDHPHICRTLSWEYVEDLGHCIVLEYIDGETLQNVMESKKLNQQIARKIIAELCSALDYLHKKQIVHRDLKPSNILLTHNGDNVKLIDFSLADADDSLLLKFPAGTRRYLAPETLEDKPLDCRADIYSLGIIMGEMALKLNDKNLALVSQLCTKRDRTHRPANAQEVMQVFNKRMFPWRIWAFIIAIICLIALCLFLWEHGSMLHDDTALPYEPDSLSFGNIEIIG
jgi:serine/threonine protein kinase